MIDSRTTPGVMQRVLLISGLIWSLVSGSVVFSQESTPDSKRPTMSPTVTDILGWLPPNSETLIVTRGSYAVQPADNGKSPDRSLTEWLERWSYSFLVDLRGGIYLKKLAGREVVLAVEGARHFESGGMGLSPYEGCHLLVFKQPLGPTGDSLKKALAADANKIEKLAGHEVFFIKEKYERVEWTMFLALPRPNVLIYGTNKSYVREVLERMGKKAEGRAFPESLPEWKYVNPDARFWAIRHYTKPPEADPSRAEGLVFTYDPRGKPGVEQPAKVMYLSAGKVVRKKVERAWTYVGEQEWIPKIKMAAPGIVEITAELNHEGDAVRFLFILLYHLGHAIGC